jgi:hypothetical protein
MYVCLNQGCQVVYFQTKIPNSGKFWRALECKMLVYFMTVWYNLWPFVIVCGHLVHFSQFGTFGSRKIWQPWSKRTKLNPPYLSFSFFGRVAR